jgi:hypothetical protein
MWRGGEQSCWWPIGKAATVYSLTSPVLKRSMCLAENRPSRVLLIRPPIVTRRFGEEKGAASTFVGYFECWLSRITGYSDRHPQCQYTLRALPLTPPFSIHGLNPPRAAAVNVV